MSSRLSFVIETMEVIDGHKLKSAHPDKHGYYTVPLAVVGVVTQNRTYYIPEYFIESMVGSKSPFALQVRSGNMFGEFGHPFTKDLERIGIVMETNWSHHIRRVFTRDLPDGTTLILGEIKPFGPNGKYLEESFASPFINTAFSLRSLCNETLNRQEQRIDRIIRHFVTFDSVGSSGYKESSKRYTNLGLESLNSFENGLIDFEVTQKDLIRPTGDIIPSFESITTLNDNWITDFFDAKEVRLKSTTVPVTARYTQGSNYLTTNTGRKVSLSHALWGK